MMVASSDMLERPALEVGRCSNPRRRSCAGRFPLEESAGEAFERRDLRLDGRDCGWTERL